MKTLPRFSSLFCHEGGEDRLMKEEGNRVVMKFMKGKTNKNIHFLILSLPSLDDGDDEEHGP